MARFTRSPNGLIGNNRGRKGADGTPGGPPGPTGATGPAGAPGAGKQSVRATAPSNVSLSSPPSTMDGVALSNGDRILVRSQTVHPEQNGIYVYGATLVRAADANTWTSLVSAVVWVEEGSVNADTGWLCTVDQGGTLGTTPVAWAQIGRAGAGVGSDTIWDANGDLAVASAADTAARLAVGADGQVLTADSAQALGVKWAAAGGGGSGALTLLSTTTLASAGTFDVSSISGSYNDLIVVAIVRATSAGQNDHVNWRFNNDSGSTYIREGFQNFGNNNAVNTVESINANLIAGGTIPATTATANFFAVSQLFLIGYSSTAWVKAGILDTTGPLAAATSSTFMIHYNIFWNSTAAINRIQAFADSSGNFVTGSQLRIYGRL